MTMKKRLLMFGLLVAVIGVPFAFTASGCGPAVNPPSPPPSPGPSTTRGGPSAMATTILGVDGGK